MQKIPLPPTPCSRAYTMSVDKVSNGLCTYVQAHTLKHNTEVGWPCVQEQGSLMATESTQRAILCKIKIYLTRVRVIDSRLQWVIMILV